MKFSTAAACLLSAGTLTILAGPSAAQQGYPGKPIRYIIPYPPGGGSDVLARLIAQKLAENLGQQVIIDNRGGGNTIIGSEALVKSAPDGYTLLQSALPHIITPLLLPTPFDAIKDFAPVATLAQGELVLVAHPAVQAGNLQELVALAKLKPGQLNRGSPGEGSPARLVGSLFDIMTGTSAQNVSYKGLAPILVDLLGGQIQLTFALPTAVMPHVLAGKLKAIAISGETRIPALPQIPTFTEAGLPGFNARTWYGILVPAGTAKRIVDKLSAEIGRMLATPDFKEKLASQGFDPFVSTPGQFAALMRTDLARYAGIIKSANIKIEN